MAETSSYVLLAVTLTAWPDLSRGMPDTVLRQMVADPNAATLPTSFDSAGVSPRRLDCANCEQVHANLVEVVRPCGQFEDAVPFRRFAVPRPIQPVIAAGWRPSLAPSLMWACVVTVSRTLRPVGLNGDRPCSAARGFALGKHTVSPAVTAGFHNVYLTSATKCSERSIRLTCELAELVRAPSTTYLSAREGTAKKTCATAVLVTITTRPESLAAMACLHTKRLPRLIGMLQGIGVLRAAVRLLGNVV